MSDKIAILNVRIKPVQNIIDHLEDLLKDAKDGRIRGFFYGTVEGNGGTTWGHAVDGEGGEDLRLVKLLLHPTGELDFLLRERLRASHTSSDLDEPRDDEGEEDE